MLTFIFNKFKKNVYSTSSIVARNGTQNTCKYQGFKYIIRITCCRYAKNEALMQRSRLHCMNLIN